MEIGIDKIDFYAPNHYLDLVDLAHARNEDPNKYLIGIGQNKMTVPYADQDTVAMAANAADKMLTDEDRAQIGLVILGTESGIDQSKASTLFVHDLLRITANARSFEIKEACYGATAGLQTARDYVITHPDRKALVIASDIARYGLKTPGEVTQGAGAVAMLISKNPHILGLESQTVYQSRSTDDFWRPNYSPVAYARGKYSEEVYLDMFNQIWDEATKQGLVDADNLAAQIFHIPFSKMGRKGLRTLADKLSAKNYQRLTNRFEKSILYGKEVGNIYTGSLYLSLLSLLDNDASLQSGDRIGLFSYGSGSVAELFFGKLVPGYRNYLQKDKHQTELKRRIRLTMPEYEKAFQQGIVKADKDQQFVQTDSKYPHYLEKIENHERFYK